MLVEFAVDHFLCRLRGCGAEFGVRLTQLHIRLGGSAFNNAQSPHDRKRLLLPADPEIHQGALRLSAPIAIRIDFYWTKCVGFSSGARHLPLPSQFAVEAALREAPRRRQAGEGQSARITFYGIYPG